MRKKDANGEKVRREVIKLNNTIHWDSDKGDKVYLKSVQVSIVPSPFDTRHAFLRFSDGPALDFPLVDLDRFVLAYLELRGVKPPRKLCELASRKAPPPVDFIVPNYLFSGLAKRTRRRKE